jgi:hypothetical protein
MLKMYVRIAHVDMEGFNGREHPPTADMVGSFVRVTGMETVPDDQPYQVFEGIVVDANGEDIEGGEVELIDYEIESFEGMPVMFDIVKG